MSIELCGEKSSPSEAIWPYTYLYMEANQVSFRTHENMQDVLYKPGAEGPANHYLMLRGGVDTGNVTIWERGVVGGEYIKSFGHYHTWDFQETYHIVSGEGVALMQKRVTGEDGSPTSSAIEDFRVLRVHAGDTLDIPLGYGHILCNIGNTFLITVDNSPSDPQTAKTKPHADYEPIRFLHGFAFYLVERDGKPALLRNQNYGEIKNMYAADIPIVDQ